jgi:phytoene dehydrogenase-like protein
MPAMSRTVDAVLIGSGHNALVGAAYLAGAGWDVEVIERNAVAGGAVATEELTEPGFHHDTFSSWHPLFQISGAYAELGDELRARGLNYVDTPAATTAAVRDDGHAMIAYRDPQQTVAGFAPADRAAYIKELEGFGASIGTLGELLGTELHSFAAARLALRLRRQLGHRDALAVAGGVVSSARGWYESRFEGREVSDLYAPWALHTGLAPDDAGSGFQSLAIAGTLHQVGLPIVRGGSRGFVQAFERLIADRGGKVTTGVEVERILVRGGAAAGVVAGGEEVVARRAVVAGVTPTQLYGRLLPDGAAPAEAVRDGLRYRYGRRSGMQVHVALNEPLRWRDSRLDDVAIVHLCDGLDGVALACAQATAGLLPRAPTVVVGQPARVDPTRAPAGRGIVWIQLQEVPHRPRGDAAGEIDVGDGTWSDELVGAYVERVLSRLARHVENWPAARGKHYALSPDELERRNCNLVRGDIYAGDCELGQAYFWRPTPRYGSHATPVDRLYMCGASTFPGPGLNAASGRIVARALLRRSPLPWKRLRADREQT